MKPTLTLTKDMLADELAAHFDTSSARARRGLDRLLDSISESLARGDDVRLHGFGHFSRTSIKARTGRNPRTGETIEIPETPRVTFAPSKALKARLAS